MDTLITLKNEYNEIDGTYRLLAAARDNWKGDPGSIPILEYNLEFMEGLMCSLDKRIHELIHNRPLVVSHTEWVKAYRAKVKAL